MRRLPAMHGKDVVIRVVVQVGVMVVVGVVPRHPRATDPLSQTTWPAVVSIMRTMLKPQMLSFRRSLNGRKTSIDLRSLSKMSVIIGSRCLFKSR